MACQKVCKQDMDDIIVKVNLQSPIPTSFYITVANWCENDAGIRLCKSAFTIISSLPCFHTSWHDIPTSFYILNVQVLSKLSNGTDLKHPHWILLY